MWVIPGYHPHLVGREKLRLCSGRERMPIAASYRIRKAMALWECVQVCRFRRLRRWRPASRRRSAPIDGAPVARPRRSRATAPGCALPALVPYPRLPARHGHHHDVQAFSTSTTRSAAGTTPAIPDIGGYPRYRPDTIRQAVNALHLLGRTQHRPATGRPRREGSSPSLHRRLQPDPRRRVASSRTPITQATAPSHSATDPVRPSRRGGAR